MQSYPEKAEEVFSAARQAGYQFISNGHMLKMALTKVSQPFLSEEKYREFLNKAAIEVKEK